MKLFEYGAERFSMHNKLNENLKEKNFTNADPVVYTVKDIMRILQMGKNQTYSLMKLKGFPSFKINNEFRVCKNKFEKWLDAQTHKTIIT